MITKATAIDWLTITAWPGVDREAARLMETVTRHISLRRGPEPRSIRGYAGLEYSQESGHLWAGEGRQKNDRHCMIQAGGEASSKLMPYLLRHGVQWGQWKATRIDVQITLEKPKNYKWTKPYVWLDKNGNRTTTAWVGAEGSTIYYGASSSDVRSRLYEKDEDWLRFEVQFRRTVAGPLWDLLMDAATSDGDWQSVIEAAIYAQLEPISQCPYIAEFLAYCNPGVTISQEEKITDSSKRFKWLHKSVEPAIKRLANDHDYNRQLLRLLYEWLKIAEQANEVDNNVND